jgi:splicing factor 3B subunit 3
LPGSTKDQLIIGTDSGKVVLLQYNPEKNQFEKIHQESFGKTGCRRIGTQLIITINKKVPGQYLAIDPKGRAFMISAVEKNKFVYILTRENERISISSPLEAPKSHTIVFDIVGLDAGYDNALFAAIEVDYGDW